MSLTSCVGSRPRYLPSKATRNKKKSKKEQQNENITRDMSGISWDELSQILFFLPVTSICRYSQTNRFAYDCIRHNQTLWSELLKRDFAFIVGHLEQDQSLYLTRELQPVLITPSTMDQNCCDEMRDFMCRYVRFFQFPFNRAGFRFLCDDYVISKILFTVPDSSLNKSVIDAIMTRELVMPTVDESSDSSIDFLCLWMTSNQPTITPNMVFQLWMFGNGWERFRTDPKRFYNENQCLVITIDTRDAWSEDTYSTLPHVVVSLGYNSLSRALVSLREARLMINLEPPKACKGVLIVGVGDWSKDAPVSKQRFLKDCAQLFNRLPLEYFELNYDNVAAMSDVLLKRFYTFYQQSALEDNPPPLEVQPEEQSVPPKSRCILS